MSDDPVRKAFNMIVDGLQPLESPDRRRAVLSALRFLEEDWVPLPQKKVPERPEEPEAPTEHAASNGALSAGVRAWMKQNELKLDEVEQVFSFDDEKVAVIADLPGTSKRDDTIKLYTLMGVGTYIKTGERKFSDEAARGACTQHSAYDVANHSKTMKELKKELTGDKDNGWTITKPGLKKGASIVKELAAAAK